jgi:hypothetical protein
MFNSIKVGIILVLVLVFGIVIQSSYFRSDKKSKKHHKVASTKKKTTLEDKVKDMASNVFGILPAPRVSIPTDRTTGTKDLTHKRPPPRKPKTPTTLCTDTKMDKEDDLIIQLEFKGKPKTECYKINIDTGKDHINAPNLTKSLSENYLIDNREVYLHYRINPHSIQTRDIQVSVGKGGQFKAINKPIKIKDEIKNGNLQGKIKLMEAAENHNINTIYIQFKRA